VINNAHIQRSNIESFKIKEPETIVNEALGVKPEDAVEPNLAVAKSDEVLESVGNTIHPEENKDDASEGLKNKITGPNIDENSGAVEQSYKHSRLAIKNYHELFGNGDIEEDKLVYFSNDEPFNPISADPANNKPMIYSINQLK